MSSSRTMSTEQIKKGLQNIKKAQLQVLKQLRGDSYILEKQQKQAQSNKCIPKEAQMNQNIRYNNNVAQTSDNPTKNQIKSTKSNSNTQNIFQQKTSIKTNESLSQSLSSSNSNQIQKIKRQFTSQRQQLNNKLIQITNKLNSLQRQSFKQRNNQKNQYQIIQLTSRIKYIQQQKCNLSNMVILLRREKQELMRDQKRYKDQMQLKCRQRAILQAQMKFLQSQMKSLKHQSKSLESQNKSLKSQGNKLLKLNRQLQDQVKHAKSVIRQRQNEHRQFLGRHSNPEQPQEKLNVDLLIRQVRTISTNHDHLFTKLRQYDRLQMSCVLKQQQIQNSFSRLLEYLQVMSTCMPMSKSQMVSQSRDQQRQELEYFVREIGEQSDPVKTQGNQQRQIGSLRQIKQLKLESQSLRRRLRELTLQLQSYKSSHDVPNAARSSRQGSQPSRQVPQLNKQASQSNRLITLQLQQMRLQVQKLKRYKLSLKTQQQQQQQQNHRHKSKCRQLQGKIQVTERRLVQATNSKFSLEKKCQQLEIQVTQLNSIIKELSVKVHSGEGEYSQSSSLFQLRQQFSKLLQTNTLLMREKQSLKAMNQSLQVQIQTLKYQKQQLQTNNKQKHELIEKQIKQRDKLLGDLEKKQSHSKQLMKQIQKLKGTSRSDEQQSSMARKHLEDLLLQKNQELLQLRNQVEELYRQSREYHQLSLTFDKLQIQHKQLMRKSLKVGETFRHLWSVKQAEYYNVNQILGMLTHQRQRQPSDIPQQL